MRLHNRHLAAPGQAGPSGMTGPPPRRAGAARSTVQTRTRSAWFPPNLWRDASGRMRLAARSVSAPACPGGWVGSSGHRARTWASSVGQPRAWRTIDSCALPSTTSSGAAEQCWHANTSIRESVCRRRPDLRVNDAQPGRAAGAETGIAPSAPGRLRRGHRGHRGLIPLHVGLGS